MTDRWMVLFIVGMIGASLGMALAFWVDSRPEKRKPTWHAIAVRAPDGRPVLCIANSGDGISCDWAHR